MSSRKGMKKSLVGYLPIGWKLKKINLYGIDKICVVKRGLYNGKYHFQQSVLVRPRTNNLAKEYSKVRITIEEVLPTKRGKE